MIRRIAQRLPQGEKNNLVEIVPIAYNLNSSNRLGHIEFLLAILRV
jgi:hypothetical protein